MSTECSKMLSLANDNNAKLCPVSKMLLNNLLTFLKRLGPELCYTVCTAKLWCKSTEQLLADICKAIMVLKYAHLKWVKALKMKS